MKLHWQSSNQVITLKVQILSYLTQVVLQICSKEYSFHNNLFEEISKESTDAAIASQLLVKSLYRCVRAFALLDNNSEQAFTCLQRCKSYDRNNVDVQRLRNELENERRVNAYICVLWLFIFNSSRESRIYSLNFWTRVCQQSNLFTCNALLS